MADYINPYANPYLPSFVSQRPRVNNTQLTMPTINTPVYTQIKSVNGFEGARNYAINNLTLGSSDIIAESDPDVARVYIVAKDQNNQIIVEGYRMVKEEEPKPVTMDDLNTKMSELLDRMNKLEEERNYGDKSGSNSSWEATRQSDVWSDTSCVKSTGGNSTYTAK